MSLLSPSGGFLMGPMKTPRLARLSAILSADMEPQMPQEPAPTDMPAGNTSLPSQADLFSPITAHAGTDRTHSAAKFDDRCTEICEAAQGERRLQAAFKLAAPQRKQTVRDSWQTGCDMLVASLGTSQVCMLLTQFPVFCTVQLRP
jgi:hypothetical protein